MAAVNTSLTGRGIKAYREFRNIKQSELANMLGVPRTTLSHWESSGKVRPNTLSQIADLLDTTVGELRSGGSLVSLAYLVGKADIPKSIDAAESAAWSQYIRLPEEERRNIVGIINHYFELCRLQGRCISDTEENTSSNSATDVSTDMVWLTDGEKM